MYIKEIKGMPLNIYNTMYLNYRDEDFNYLTIVLENDLLYESTARVQAWIHVLVESGCFGTYPANGQSYFYIKPKRY